MVTLHYREVCYSTISFTNAIIHLQRLFSEYIITFPTQFTHPGHTNGQCACVRIKCSMDDLLQ